MMTMVIAALACGEVLCVSHIPTNALVSASARVEKHTESVRVKIDEKTLRKGRLLLPTLTTDTKELNRVPLGLLLVTGHTNPSSYSPTGENAKIIN